MTPPPTEYSSARLSSPSSISEALAVVPPMSNEIAFAMPICRMSAWTPTTPAAGPLSMMFIGVTAAALAVVRPPFDCISKKWRIDPDAREIGGQGRQVSFNDGSDIGVDDGGRCSLIFLDLGQYLGADTKGYVGCHLPRYPFDHLLVRGVVVGMNEANGDRLDPFVQQLLDRPRGIDLAERPLDLALGVDALVDL